MSEVSAQQARAKRETAQLGGSRHRANARAEDAYQALRLQLLEGPWTAGDRISVVDIAADLGCSRVPVMEAVKRLEGEGLITIVPQVGCTVTIPSAAEVHDFFTLFAAAEGAITRLAAERRTRADLVEFSKVCAEVDSLLETAGGPTARDPIYRRANLLFHSEIHRMARAPSASGIASSLWDRSDFYIKLAFGSLHFSQPVRRAHAAIRRALIAGNVDSAERAVEAHLRAVGASVSRHIATRD